MDIDLHLIPFLPKVCGHFEDLFMRLKDFSVFIKGVSAEDSMVVTAPQSAD